MKSNGNGRRSWRRPLRWGLLAWVLGAGGVSVGQAEPGYLSEPDIHEDLVVFSAEGDLWTAATDGHGVGRLTSHSGTERRPRFSPDGRWIAFTGHYDGNNDVYVVPVTGGEPRRLTWHPFSDRVVGWTPDGSKIIFSSSRRDPHYAEHLYTVPAEGGAVVELSLGRANYLDIDAERGRWAFTRTWGGGTWKRYRGGTAPEIWVGHPDRADYREVTDFDGPDLFPMWHAGRVYFVADQGGTVNIWSMLPDGSNRTRHTREERWDIRSPAMGPGGAIVYSLAGQIHRFDPADGSTRALPIELPSERVLTRRRYPDPERYVTRARLSPDGERLAVVARGEIFSVPVEEGVTLPITRGSGARERGVDFGPEGERVVYITDASREEAIVTADAWGRGEVEEVKKPTDRGWYFPPAWSPDGRWIAYADMTYRLYVVAAEGIERRTADRSDFWEISEYTWSPDGRWLAYTKHTEGDLTSIMIYDVEQDTTHRVTGPTTNDWSPSWDPQGRYLYFLSDRTINPMFSGYDYAAMLGPMARPYMLLLRSDVENPFLEDEGLPPSGDEDEEKDAKDQASGDEADGVEGDDGDEGQDADAADGEDEDEDDVEPVEIEFDGLADRLIELPVQAGNYQRLQASAKKLFYLDYPMRGMNEEDESPGPRATLMTFDLEDEEAETFVKGVGGFHLQPKAGKVMIAKGPGKLFVVEAGSAPGDDLSEAAVSLDGLVIELDPREEWEQIYYEAWRQLRDFYWDESLHGLDWPRIRDQYAELLPRIATRDELGDLLAEMIGELSTSHTYVWGGDDGRKVPGRSTGLLGAELEREGDAFRVVRIYRGDAIDRVRSPLLEPGVDVSAGDYILAVNQRPFAAELPFEASLENLAGKPVMLTVNDRPDPQGARHVVVKPLSNEHRLIYVDWVRRNREYVAEKTGGKIGYVHIPDMGSRGLVAFNSWFYPQLTKEGMVVDVRYNGGGWVSQLILQCFQREVLSWDRQRYGNTDPYPARVLNGPFVVVVNEHAGSDGDIFPQAVQLAGLAPVIGTRSWGGVNGIRVNKHLVDGGVVTHPEFAWWDDRVGWGLEGHGVDPDIEVENLPQDLARGIDAQLDRAIEEVMRLHREHPPDKPDFGPAPDRSRRAYRNE